MSNTKTALKHTAKNETANAEKIDFADPAKGLVPPSMSDLFYIPFSAIAFKHEPTYRLLDGIVRHMAEECGGSSQGAYGIFLTSQRTASEGKDVFARSNGMYLLVEGNQVLTSAMLCSATQVSFIYTPPKHRRKGYSAELLRRVADGWMKHTTTLPLWICADTDVYGVPQKAGWVCDGTKNTDGTMDFYHPLIADRYLKQRALCQSRRENLADIMEQSLRTNKNHNDPDGEYEKYITNFSQVAQRKVIGRLRVDAPPSKHRVVKEGELEDWFIHEVPKPGAKVLDGVALREMLLKHTDAKGLMGEMLKRMGLD